MLSILLTNVYIFKHQLLLPAIMIKDQLNISSNLSITIMEEQIYSNPPTVYTIAKIKTSVQ